MIGVDDRHVTITSDDISDGYHQKWHAECFLRNSVCSLRRRIRRFDLESTTAEQFETRGQGICQFMCASVTAGMLDLLPKTIK
jgi:hypothetical protein